MCTQELLNEAIPCGEPRTYLHCMEPVGAQTTASLLRLVLKDRGCTLLADATACGLVASACLLSGVSFRTQPRSRCMTVVLAHPLLSSRGLFMWRGTRPKHATLAWLLRGCICMPAAHVRVAARAMGAVRVCN